MTQILIIEDNDEINQMLQDLLVEDYQVLAAYSGTEGLLRFQTEAIDLVLLDIMLPGKSGAEVLQEIRTVSQVPVIMLTALGDKKSVTQFLLQGANDYITKPFDLEEVLARITVQLRDHQPIAQPTTLSYKKLRLNEANFEITAADQAIRLGKKEFAIFKCLLEHPHQIFTKEQLFEQIWQEQYFPGDNTLNTQLSTLRKKIAQLDRENEYIETIWGLGVRLAGEKE